MVGNAIMSIIFLAITAIVIANVFIPQVRGTNTTGWSTGEIALWGVVTLVCIAGFVYQVAASFGFAG